MTKISSEREEIVAHIVSECSKLAQKQYKQWRHDKVAQVLHWQLCKDNKIEYNEKWYKHQPKTVVENENAKILWDMRIQTDKVLAHNKPDIVIINKGKRLCTIIDVTCPFDTRVLDGEREKIDRYKDLKWGLKEFGTVGKLK